MSFWGFRPYVSVAQRRVNAQKEIQKLMRAGRTVSPVVTEGRKIAASFWGKAWCENLERYSDYENRLPRGRTYVNNGSVVDLQISRGKVEALVSGSDIYKVKVDVAVAAPSRWKAICSDCAGSIASIVELLQGKFSKNVMERVCRESDGLFPASKEIKMSCSCPDSAGMCKHIAASLYGVGARLDVDPDVLFKLRGVDRSELVATGADLSITQAAAKSGRVLADDDMAALFGLEIETASGEKRRRVVPTRKTSAKKTSPAGAPPRPVKIAAAKAKTEPANTTSKAATRKAPAGAGRPRATIAPPKVGTPANALTKTTIAATPSAKPTLSATATVANKSVDRAPYSHSSRTGPTKARLGAAKWIGAKARKLRKE